jgi:hypothetical protein
MFVQVIEGRVSDEAGLHRQMDRWEAELRPGAAGFLGSTGGVTDDGVGFAIARFESAAAAKANSDRAEQGEWWSDTEKCFSGPVSFTDSEDVEEFLGGGSNDAGFVQVMEGRVTDVEEARQFIRRGDAMLHEERPDLIGGFIAFHGDGGYTEAAYFTSEAAAREGERREPSAEAKAFMADWERLFPDIHYHDLRDPWLV